MKPLAIIRILANGSIEFKSGDDLKYTHQVRVPDWLRIVCTLLGRNV